jgi:cation transport regulator
LPYRTNADLPVPVRRHLPKAAQRVYREAFNHAWKTYRGRDRQEEIAHRVAWTAVKKGYRKDGERWVQRDRRAAAGGRIQGFPLRRSPPTRQG